MTEQAVLIVPETSFEFWGTWVQDGSTQNQFNVVPLALPYGCKANDAVSKLSSANAIKLKKSQQPISTKVKITGSERDKKINAV